MNEGEPKIKKEHNGGGFLPSPPPPSFSVLTTVQLSRGYNSYFANHKIKNTPKKPTPTLGVTNVANYLYKKQKVGSA